MTKTQTGKPWQGHENGLKKTIRKEWQRERQIEKIKQQKIDEHWLQKLLRR